MGKRVDREFAAKIFSESARSVKAHKEIVALSPLSGFPEISVGEYGLPVTAF